MLRMTDPEFRLAQFNVSRLLAPLDAPEMREFVAFLAPVNAFAEQSHGFLWRLKDADGGASSYMPSPYPDSMMITNLTVWTDLESLRLFTYDTAHRYFLQNRKKWFDRMTTRQLVLWWLPPAELPTLTDAMTRLDELERCGSSPTAFSFQSAFDPHGNPLAFKATVDSKAQ
jgi:hypothetical protein